MNGKRTRSGERRRGELVVNRGIGREGSKGIEFEEALRGRRRRRGERRSGEGDTGEPLNRGTKRFRCNEKGVVSVLQ